MDGEGEGEGEREGGREGGRINQRVEEGVKSKVEEGVVAVVGVRTVECVDEIERMLSSWSKILEFTDRYLMNSPG